MSNRIGTKLRCALIVSAACTLALLTGCSSSSDSGTPSNHDGPDSSVGSPNGSPCASYPCTVTIEYRVTSTTLSNATVMYTNESGGYSTVDLAPLPFDMTFTRTIKQYDGISTSVTAAEGGDVTIELLVNGTIVKTQTFAGTSTIVGITTYLFE